MVVERRIVSGRVVQEKRFRVRREARRYPLMVLEVKGKQYNKIFVAYAENLGLGGLQLSSTQTLKVGDRFPIEFVLPDQVSKIACSCEVAWRREIGSNQDGLGIRFIDLSEQAKKVIGSWIEKEEREKQPV